MLPSCWKPPASSGGYRMQGQRAELGQRSHWFEEPWKAVLPIRDAPWGGLALNVRPLVPLLLAAEPLHCPKYCGGVLPQGRSHGAPRRMPIGKGKFDARSGWNARERRCLYQWLARVPLWADGVVNWIWKTVCSQCVQGHTLWPLLSCHKTEVVCARHT